MRRFRFTVASLEAITTDKTREFVHDDQVPALALQITPNGAKSFYVVKNLTTGKIVQRLGALQELSIPRARALAAEIVTKAATGEMKVAPKKKPLLLGQVFEEYLAFAREHRSMATLVEYTRMWEKYIKPWAGTRALSSVRRREVTAFHLDMGNVHGPIAANRLIALLRAAFNRAIREHELDLPNPANAITFYHHEARERRLEAEELPAFFKAVSEEPNRNIRDFILLAIFTGARKSNLLAMKWEDISMERGVWMVKAKESKNRRSMPIVLSSHVKGILNSRPREEGCSFVFPGREGRTNEHMVEPKAGWARICKRAGLEDLHIHDLRRSLASFQIDTGTPLEVIQKTLGHESKTTTEIYARLALDPVRASLERATEEMLKTQGTRAI